MFARKALVAGDPHAGDAAPAVRLVEPQDQRVGVLGALDRVQDEPAASRSPASPADSAPQRIGELNAAASADHARRPARCRRGGGGRRRRCAGRGRPRGPGCSGARRSEIRSVSPNARVAVLGVRQDGDAEAVLGHVGPAVAGDLVAGQVGARRVVRRALDGAEGDLVGRRRWRAPRAGTRPSGACGRRCQSTSRWTSRRREPASSRMVCVIQSRSIDDLGAQRRGSSTPIGPARAASSCARLEVRGVDVPRLPLRRLVLVELEPVGGRRERLAAVGRRRLVHRAVAATSVARRCSLASTTRRRRAVDRHAAALDELARRRTAGTSTSSALAVGSTDLAARERASG